MKWDKKNKHLLYICLGKKAKVLGSINDRQNQYREWVRFLKSQNIVQVERGCERGDMFWRESFDDRDAEDKRFYDPKRVIIKDPFLKESVFGLSIPKDVAEKFLLLGIP